MGADAERRDENREGGKAWIPPQAACSILEIPKQVIEKRQVGHIAAFFLVYCDFSHFTQRSLSCGSRCEAPVQSVVNFPT